MKNIKQEKRAEKRTLRKKTIALLHRAFFAGRCMANYLYNLKEKRIRVQQLRTSNIAEYEKNQERLKLIDQMTNWQRNQAGKACKGDFSKLNMQQARYYASLPHWKSA